MQSRHPFKAKVGYFALGLGVGRTYHACMCVSMRTRGVTLKFHPHPDANSRLVVDNSGACSKLEDHLRGISLYETTISIKKRDKKWISMCVHRSCDQTQ